MEEETEATARVPARGRKLPPLPLPPLLPLPTLRRPPLPRMMMMKEELLLRPAASEAKELLLLLLPFLPRLSPSTTTRTRSSPRRSS